MRLDRKYRKWIDWWKVILPLRNIRFFPPRFIIRDPIVEGVSQAFKKGHEVAVIVYHIRNLQDISQWFGESEMEMAIQTLKKTFREVTEQEQRTDSIILIDYHYGDGFTVYFQVEDDIEQRVFDVEALMNKLYMDMKHSLSSNPIYDQLIVDKGFMFIDKSYTSVQDAIYSGRKQALTMAEKRVKSEYLEMRYKMKKIIQKKEIRMFAQPIMDMMTKEIHAWEMLTRGPEGTNLEMPLRLFSVARQTGNLYDLEMIVLERIFEKMKETGCHQEIFVNFTPLTLGNKRFVQDLQTQLANFSTVNPRQIIIEMTEQDSVDEKKGLIDNIKKLRTLGFRFALDDTGAGYSNLYSIGEILPEIIKIDRALIQNIHESSVNESMLRGILLVAREVGSRVVAEGIEKGEEISVLSRHEVDYAQGYYFARPTDFTHQLLASHS
ncbi:EAL domain-containing protein [Bacillus tuaregi]|uniref:EAL domain-containing protein n=1 Tax=Bacillus tuaregi TaxID=1816695 RepID=UPI0008F86092|nr:EAL domain-containing protein [Bacillus tuaregi]